MKEQEDALCVALICKSGLRRKRASVATFQRHIAVPRMSVLES